LKAVTTWEHKNCFVERHKIAAPLRDKPSRPSAFERSMPPGRVTVARSRVRARRHGDAHAGAVRAAVLRIFDSEDASKLRGQ
jgi:hypothetical protein